MSTRGKNKEDAEDNDVWSTVDSLTLASIVQRMGERNWVFISRSMKLHGRGSHDLYTPKKCAVQYNKLFKNVDDNKKKPSKRTDKERRFLEDLLVKKLHDQRMQELQSFQIECETLHRSFAQVEKLIDKGYFDEEDNLECLASEMEKFSDAWQNFSSNDCPWNNPANSNSEQQGASASVLATKGKSPAASSEDKLSGIASADQDISPSMLLDAAEVQQVLAAAVAATPQVRTSTIPSQSFFSPNSALASAAARQLVAATMPATTSMPKPPDISGLFCSAIPKTIPSPATSVTLSAPTLSKLLEMPPSIPGKLPPLPTSLYTTTIQPVRMPSETHVVKDTNIKEKDLLGTKLLISPKQTIVGIEPVKDSTPEAMIVENISDNACMMSDNNLQSIIKPKSGNAGMLDKIEDNNNSATDTEVLSSENSSTNSNSDNAEQTCEKSSTMLTKMIKPKCKGNLKEQTLNVSQSPDDAREPFDHTDNRTSLKDVRVIPDSNTSSADISSDGDKEKGSVDKPFSISAVDDITEDTVLNEVDGPFNTTGRNSDSGRTTFSTVGSTTFSTVGKTPFGTVGSNLIESAPFSTVGMTFGSVGRTSFNVEGGSAFRDGENIVALEKNENFRGIATKRKLIGSDYSLCVAGKENSDNDSNVLPFKECILKFHKVADDFKEKSPSHELGLSGNSSSSSLNKVIINAKKIDAINPPPFVDNKSGLLENAFPRKSEKSADGLLLSPERIKNSEINLKGSPSLIQNNKAAIPGLILDSLKQFAVASGVGEDSDKLTSSSDHSSSETLSISSSSQDSDSKNGDKSSVSSSRKTDITFTSNPKKGQCLSPSPTKTRNASRASGSPCKIKGSPILRKQKASTVCKGLSGKNLSLHLDELCSPTSDTRDSSASDIDNSESLSPIVESTKNAISDTTRPFSAVSSVHENFNSLQDLANVNDSSEPLEESESNEELSEEKKESSEKINISNSETFQNESQTSTTSPSEKVTKKQALSRRGRRSGRTTPKNSDNDNGNIIQSALDLMRDVEVTLEPLSAANASLVQGKIKEEEESETLKSSQKASKTTRRGRKPRGKQYGKTVGESTEMDEEQNEKEDSSCEGDMEDTISCKIENPSEKISKSKCKDSDKENSTAKSFNFKSSPQWEDDNSLDKKPDVGNLVESLEKPQDKTSDDQSSSSSSSSASSLPSSPASSGSGISDEKDAFENSQDSDSDAQKEETKNLGKDDLESLTTWNVASTSPSESSGESTDDSDETLSASKKILPKVKRFKKDHDAQHQYKRWKKSICMIWREASYHKYANVFSQKVTDDVAPGYQSIVYRPMDLSLIKKNIDNGTISTTEEFQRDMMLMFQNAIMYNSSDHDVYHMAVDMQRDAYKLIQDYIATQLVIEEKVEPPVVQPSLRAGRRAKSLNKGQRSSGSKASKE